MQYAAARYFQFDIRKKIFTIFRIIEKNTQYNTIGTLFTPPDTFLQKLDFYKKRSR